MFTSTNGARGAEIPKLLISITDGKQTERTWMEGDEEWVGKVNEQHPYSWGLKYLIPFDFRLKAGEN